ncbi:MAG: M48 family metallopeptidase [Haloarculaceae archaeon]
MTPPAVALAAYLLVALASGVAVRWRARRYHADPESDPETAFRLRRLRRRGALAGWVATTGVTARFGVAAAARDALSSTLGADPVAAAVGTLGAYLVPALPVALAVRLGTVPYRRAARDLRVRYRDAAAWELERDGAGVVLVLTAAALIALTPGGWPRVLVAAGLGLVAVALAPFALVVALRTRWPSDAERDLLGDVLGGVHLRVVDDRTRVGSAVAAGVLPGARYVFVTESLFDVLDDDEVRAVVAHEVGHHERHHVLLRFALLAAAAAVALALVEFAPDLALGAVLVGAGPTAVALAWVVRRTEESADAYAAATVGGPALADALETLVERRYVIEATGLLRVLSYHPPLSERTADLRRGPGPPA